MLEIIIRDVGNINKKEADALRDLFARWGSECCEPTPGLDANTFPAPEKMTTEIKFPKVESYIEDIHAAELEAVGLPPISTANGHEIPVSAVIGVELDAEGMPWDKRIHAQNKAKTEKGLWKAARGLNPALKRSVTAELQAAMHQKTLSVPAPLDFIPPPPTETATSVPVADPFDGYISRVTVLVKENKLSIQDMTDIVKSFGLATIASVSSRPDLIPAILAVVESKL